MARVHHEAKRRRRQTRRGSSAIKFTAAGDRAESTTTDGTAARGFHRRRLSRRGDDDARTDARRLQTASLRSVLRPMVRSRRQFSIGMFRRDERRVVFSLERFHASRRVGIGCRRRRARRNARRRRLQRRGAVFHRRSDLFSHQRSRHHDSRRDRRSILRRGVFLRRRVWLLRVRARVARSLERARTRRGLESAPAPQCRTCQAPERASSARPRTPRISVQPVARRTAPSSALNRTKVRSNRRRAPSGRLPRDERIRDD